MWIDNRWHLWQFVSEEVIICARVKIRWLDNALHDVLSCLQTTLESSKTRYQRLCFIDLHFLTLKMWTYFPNDRIVTTFFCIIWSISFTSLTAATQCHIRVKINPVTFILLFLAKLKLSSFIICQTPCFS